MNISEIKELLAGTPTAEQLATLAADERKGVQKLLAAYNKRLEKAAAEKERFAAMLKLERELYDEGCELIAGVDEAGRGPLAGPLVIAAVILPNGIAGIACATNSVVAKSVLDRATSAVNPDVVGGATAAAVAPHVVFHAAIGSV